MRPNNLFGQVTKVQHLVTPRGRDQASIYREVSHQIHFYTPVRNRIRAAKNVPKSFEIPGDLGAASIWLPHAGRCARAHRRYRQIMDDASMTPCHFGTHLRLAESGATRESVGGQTMACYGGYIATSPTHRRWLVHGSGGDERRC